MARTVYCKVLKREAEGLDHPPYPGEIGQRIFDEISREAWQQWLERLVTIMNEYRLSSADPDAVALIEQHMRGFLFGEGDMGKLPQGFTPGSRKK